MAPGRVTRSETRIRSRSTPIYGSIRCGVCLIVLLAMATVLPLRPALGIVSSWRPRNGSTDWLDSRNWSSGVPQVVGDTARFNAAPGAPVSVQLNQSAGLGQVTMSGVGEYSLSGNGLLVFDDPVTRRPRVSLFSSGGASTATISNPMLVPVDATLTLSLQTESTLNLHGTISGGGNLIYTGPSSNIPAVTISGAHTYSGSTLINLGRNSVVDAQTTMAFGSAEESTTVRSGRVYLFRGTPEPFLVERYGTLAPTPDSAPYTGTITLAQGTLNPDRRFSDEEDQTVVIASDIIVQGRGHIGQSPFQMSSSQLTGNIAGQGTLELQGAIRPTTTFDGSISLKGDLEIADRASVVVNGVFHPTGDVIVNGRLSPASLLLAGDLSQFRGGLWVESGLLSVHSSAHVDVLRVDERTVPLEFRRPTRQATVATVAHGALLVADTVDFFAGGIAGQIGDIPVLVKTTSRYGTLAGLVGFSGDIEVDEGWLAVNDDNGLGAATGQTRLARSHGAALVLADGVRTQETILLNNASGIDFTGGLLGDGEMAGDLWLGNRGSYLGGFGGAHTMDFDQGGNLEIRGAIHGGSLFKTGSNTELTISGSGHTFSGTTDVLAGTVVLSDNGRLTTTSRVNVGMGRMDHSGIAQPTLRLINTSTSVQDRIADAIPLELQHGRMELIGDNSSSSRESVGQVMLGSGVNQLYAASATLDIGQLNRQVGALGLFLAAGGRVRIGNPSLDDGILGGWALYGSSADAPIGFATVNANEVALAAMATQSLNSSTASQNVRLISDSLLTHDVTVNSLQTFGTIDINGHRLTIDSGGMFSTQTTSIRGGQLSVGGRGTGELFVHAYQNVDINSAIVDSVLSDLMLHVSGNSDVRLSGANTYGGGSVVSGESRLHILNPSAVPPNDSVTLNGGEYHLDFSGPAVPLHALVLRSGGRIVSENQTAVAPNHIEVFSGTIDTPLAGDGSFVKRGEDMVAWLSSSLEFTGPIVVEQGLLDMRLDGVGSGGLDEDHAIRVLEGGTLHLYQTPSQRLVILDGGVLRSATSSTVNQGLQMPIEIRAGGTIETLQNRTNLTVAGRIFGASDLTLSGSFGFERKLEFTSTLDELQGDVILAGGSVVLSGSSPRFQGLAFVRAADARTVTPQAFGPAGAIIDRPGHLTVAGSLLAPVEIRGGTLVSGSQRTILRGPLHFSESGTIETPENLENGIVELRDLETLADVTLNSEIRVKKSGGGQWSLRGPLHVGADTELVAWEGSIDIANKIVATTQNSSLDMVGNVETAGSLSLEVPAGTGLRLLQNGLPRGLALSGAAAELTGAGTVRGNVRLDREAGVSPGPDLAQLTIDGDAILGPGAIYEWQLGMSDGLPQGDHLHVESALAFEATAGEPWILSIAGHDPLPPAPQVERWLLASARSLDGFDPSAVLIDASHLFSTHPDYALGRFLLAASGTNLYLDYVNISKADFNGDGSVDNADVGVMFSAWGSAGPTADLNDDRIVDAADAGILFRLWTGDPVANSVPEPAAAPLLSLMVCVVGAYDGWRLRRRSDRG